MRKTKNIQKSRQMAYLRGKLLEKRRMLLEQMNVGVSSAMEENRNPVDDADVANSQLAQETEMQIGSIESRAVAEIDNALRRIESGKYGVCEDCGKRIPVVRLKALPFAYLCVQCKEKEEQERGSMPEFTELEWNPFEEFDGGGSEEEESSQATYKGKRVY